MSKVYHYICYQGVCHKCQEGYYYPNGDIKEGVGSKKELKCVVCGYSRTKSKQLI